MGKYDDIINLPHHVSDYHKPMSMKNRAAQFAPFAALSGYEEAIAEKTRTTESMKELSQVEIELLSEKIKLALENETEVKITYFLPDKTKSGGSYQDFKGIIQKVDETENRIIMKNGYKIPIHLITDVILKFPTPETDINK